MRRCILIYKLSVGYPEDEILKILKGNRSIDFEYELLTNDEKYIKTLNYVTGSIAFNSNSEIMGTGSFELLEEEIKDYNFIDMRIAPFFKLRYPYGWLRFPLGVYIMTSPRRMIKNSRVYNSVDCYDKSIILKEDKFTDRLFISAGANYVKEIVKILNSSGIVKVNIEFSPLICGADLEFEIGTEKLYVINELLYAINYEPVHFDRVGTAVSSRYIEPSGREAEESYCTDRLSIIRDGAEQSTDLYNVPNIVIRYTDNPDIGQLKSQFVNDKESSILSTVNRKRKVVDIESVDDIADQDTLNAYTKRVAIEKSQINDTVSIQTALMPHHGYKNCLFISHDKLEIGSKFIESAWSMDLQVSGSMNHEIKKVTII